MSDGKPIPMTSAPDCNTFVVHYDLDGGNIVRIVPPANETILDVIATNTMLSVVYRVGEPHARKRRRWWDAWLTQ